MKIILRAFSIGALCLAVLACSGSGRPPVINKAPYRIIPADTEVLAGDSLYSVAWRFGLDYQKIAKWNGLRKPYKVNPGQSLRLHSAGAPGSSQPPATAAAVVASRSKPVAKPIVKPMVKPVKKPQPATAAPSESAAAPSMWNWPAKGKVIRKFSRGKGQNGINIAGKAGSAVRATAAGDVVYAGEGLRGYGKLVIVKHSPSYLSAYAHNRKILVAEGDSIKSNQPIAQMGNSGTDRTMLHFEIRKDGKPVDPLGRGFLRVDK